MIAELRRASGTNHGSEISLGPQDRDGVDPPRFAKRDFEVRRSDVTQDELDSGPRRHRGRIDVLPGVYLAGRSEREPGN